jgi:hypothetical protein
VKDTVGALLGLTAGDALGTTLEFKPPGSFAPLADMTGGGPFDTDDEWVYYGQYLFSINSKRCFCLVGKLRVSKVWLKRLGDNWSPNKSE